MRWRSKALAAALVTPVIVSGALACGFEDPDSAAMQRGILNLTYPNALYVQGALTHARLNGTIAPPAAAAGQDLFGSELRQATARLQQFSSGLRPGDDDDFAFSLVLIEPMLWTRYIVSGGAVGVSVHASGPGEGDVVVVSSSAALNEIVAGRLTLRRAEETGLIRFYGDPAKLRRLFVERADSF
jgi:hypothetical protein